MIYYVTEIDEFGDDWEELIEAGCFEEAAKRYAEEFCWQGQTRSELHVEGLFGEVRRFVLRTSWADGRPIVREVG